MINTLTLQKLPPKQAHFCIEVCHFLEEINFSLKGKKLIIGLSGGVDSTALLLLCVVLQKKYNLEIMAVHINHSLRAESEQEAEHVKKLCDDFNISCLIFKENVKELAKEWKKGIEESARIVRYQHFEEERQRHNFDFIVLGHHLNDLAEDVLMRQIRGTSLEQSVGMSAFDSGRFLMRPFLCTEKEKLVKFVQSCDISWVEDNSNNSTEYLRNRVRLSILPLILQENPSFLKNIKNNWKQGQNDKEYWKEKVQSSLKKILIEESSNKIILNRKLFCKKEKALRLRILAESIRRIGSQAQAEMLLKTDNLVLKNESNKELSLNNKILMKIKKEILVFFYTG